MEKQVPLCVDLDGTLVHTDLLIESFFQIIKNNLFNIVLSIGWLLHGKAVFKSRIADIVDLDPVLLPYNKEFLSFLEFEKARGRELVLVSASHYKFCKKIADHIGLFDGVIATKDGINLSGRYKLNALQEYFGGEDFDYAGNSMMDLIIWQHARKAILVTPERGVEYAAKSCASVERIFTNNHAGPMQYFKALRPHHWLKNLLLFTVLFVSHQWHDLLLVAKTFGAFVAFCMCASGAYIFNDLTDLPEDRLHNRKRLRPFAAGTASIKIGVLLAVVLPPVSIAISFFINLKFTSILCVYYVFTLLYSSWFKRIVLVDIFVLAGLYTLRIIAGGAVVNIVPSFWLLAFSIFLFLSLAMVKRFSELIQNRSEYQKYITGRGYQIDDLETLNSFGTASGYMSIVVLSFYINSPEVLVHYSNPRAIWLLCPTILYWITRIWLISRRGRMHDDPIVFAIKDRTSLFIGVACLVIILLALKT